MKQVEILTLDEAVLEKGRGKDKKPRKKKYPRYESDTGLVRTKKPTKPKLGWLWE